MSGSLKNTLRLAKQHFWGIVLLVLLFIGANASVHTWKAKHPGAMSVLESQAMDMSAMKAPEGAVPVATEVVHLGPFSATVTYTGSVAPLQEQLVYPRVEGILRDLKVYNGDHIRHGQVLAVVISPDLQSKVAEAVAGEAAAASEIPSAQYNVVRMAAEKDAARGEVQAAQSDAVRANAALTAAQRAVTQKQRELDSTRANAVYWRAEIAREKKLLDAGAVSVQEYQAEQAQAAAAEAELGNKQAAVEEARANVTAAQADVENRQHLIAVARQRVSAATAALAGSAQEVRQKAAAAQQARAAVTTAAAINNYRQVLAPFAGTLTQRYVSPGQFVTSSTAIVNIVQVDTVRLQVNVADSQLASIHVGAPVTAHFAKDPRLVMQAVVTAISPLADQASRTATVEAIVPNPGHRLLPGDAVTLDIAISSSADILTVPSSALVQMDGQPAVWVARSEGAKGKTLYTCTMHPEVISDKPGTCPKCLMKLVPTKSGGNKKAHRVMVRTGAGSGDRTQVLSGLSDGAEVITQGNTYLKEGDTVFPTTWSADGPAAMSAADGMESQPGMQMTPSIVGKK